VTDAQRRMWTMGDYSVLARHLLPISLATVDAIGIRPGDRVLDVGVGTGNAAVEAARRGARVVGVDLAPAQVERALARCAHEGVAVELRVGDAQALDLPDAAFDVVLSVLGVIFAPDHAAAMAELARVCAPGGTVAVTSWAAGGWSSRWRARAARIVPPAAGPSPEEWGRPDEVVRRFAAVGLHPEVEERPFAFTFSSTTEAFEVFTGGAGPVVQFLDAAERLGRGDEAHHELREALEESNVADDRSCRLPAPYLLARGRAGRAP
jgi:SAM-dependent methyltransferase